MQARTLEAAALQPLVEHFGMLDSGLVEGVSNQRSLQAVSFYAPGTACHAISSEPRTCQSPGPNAMLHLVGAAPSGGVLYKASIKRRCCDVPPGPCL